MRVTTLIAEFNSIFSTSFRHTAKVKYNIEFKNSNIVTILKNLKRLIETMESGISNEVHVGYDFTLEDVHYVLNLLNKLIEHYKESFGGIPNNLKSYTAFEKLRSFHSPNPRKIAADVLNNILSPSATVKP